MITPLLAVKPTASAPPIDPTTISDLRMWLARAALAGLADNDPVTSWNSFTYGHHVSQSTSGAKPVCKIEGGKRFVRFTTDDWMVSGVNCDSLITPAAFTIFTVFRPSSIATNNADPWLNDPVYMGAGDNFGLVLKATSDPEPVKTAVGYHYSGASATQAPTTVATGSWQIFTHRHFSGTMGLQRNNETEVTVPSGDTGFLNGPFYLARPFGYPPRFNGDIAELLIYNTALSSGNITAVKNYLATEHAITL